MDNISALPKRKHPRLTDFDYSAEGVYFVTICTQNKRCLLSNIVGRGFTPAEEYEHLGSVRSVVELTPYGKIAEEQLFLLEERFLGLAVDEYVIMPNHIHVIFAINTETAGVNPRPTVMDIVCAYKSLTTRECKKIKPIKKLFQTSFYEHIIRNEKDYNETVAYISGNPDKWLFDKLYSEE